MPMARLSPRNGKFTVIYETRLAEAKDGCRSDIIFYAANLKVSEKLALTLCSTYKCVEGNCVSN
jgi:hypothetical protein